MSAADAVFGDLRLWRDANHNGLSEPAELRPPGSLGGDAFEPQYHEAKRTDEFGNRFAYRAKVSGGKHSRAGRRA